MIVPLSVAVLAITAFPATRLCLQPLLWSQYRRVGLALVTVLAVYALFIVAAWRNFPLVLPYAAIAAAIPAVFFWWRSRPYYGVKKGLPPGSLSMVRSLASIDDPGYYLEGGNKYGHIFKMSQFHRPTLCITNIEKGLDLIRNNEEKLSPAPLPFDRFIPRRFIRYMEQADHRHYRGMFKKIILPEIVVANTRLIQEASSYHLGLMNEASTGSLGIHPLPFMRNFTYDFFPVIFFGLKPGSVELEQLKALYGRLDAFSLDHRYPDEIEDILCDIEALILARGNTFSQNDSDSPRLSFLEELVHINPDAINDVTLRRNMLYIMKIGRGDVTSFLNWIWHFLSLNPEWLEKVRQQSEPADLINWRSLDSQVDRVIAETLRMEQSEYLYREVLGDIEWNNFQIPKGWLIRVCTHEAHRNEDSFYDPDKFDPDRFLSKKFMPAEFSPLGMGMHSCLGAHMAFVVARCMILHLASQYQLEMVNPGKRVQGGKHWMHWKPDDSFALKLHSRE
jgi:cytochrome P450